MIVHLNKCSTIKNIPFPLIVVKPFFVYFLLLLLRPDSTAFSSPQETGAIAAALERVVDAVVLTGGLALFHLFTVVAYF
jgi:hypothetical protein